jgi:hypothetical protein
METNIMIIPLWTKILVIFLSILGVVLLAAQEVIFKWLNHFFKFILFRPKKDLQSFPIDWRTFP